MARVSAPVERVEQFAEAFLQVTIKHVPHFAAQMFFDFFIRRGRQWSTVILPGNNHARAYFCLGNGNRAVSGGNKLETNRFGWVNHFKETACPGLPFRDKRPVDYSGFSVKAASAALRCALIPSARLRMLAKVLQSGSYSFLMANQQPMRCPACSNI